MSDGVVRNKAGRQFDGAKTSGKNIEWMKRRGEIMAMRVQGKTLAQIADHFEISEGRVSQIINRELEKASLRQERSVDEFRHIEAERLEKMQRSIWPTALEGNQSAIGTVLRIMERRAKLFGLDAPQQKQIKHTGDDGGPVHYEHTLDISQLSRTERELYRRLTKKALQEQEAQDVIDVDVSDQTRES